MTSAENSPMERTPRPAHPPALGHNSTTLRPSRRTRVALLVPLCAVVFFFVAREAVSEFYGLLVKRELTALRADGGGASIAELAAKPPEGTADNPAHRLNTSDFKCTFPQALSSRVPQADLDSTALAPQQKLSKAYSEFQLWHGLSIAPWIRPTGTAPFYNPRWQPVEWNDAWIPWLEKHVDQNYAALYNIRREIASGTGYFAHDWSKGCPESILEYTVLRSLANLLREDAALRARKGDAKGAFEDVRAILRLRRLVDTQPLETAIGAGIEYDARAASALHAVLEFAKPDRASAEAIIKELANREEMDSVAKALFYDTVEGLATYERNPDGAALAENVGRDTFQLSPFAKPLIRLFWLRNYDEHYYLREMRLMRAACRTPLATITNPRGQVAGQGKVLSLHLVADTLDPQDRRMVISTIWGRGSAEAAIARAALALSLYKAENSQYPDTLAALVPGYLPKIPIDPFDGAPIKYVLNENGFIVYSIGEDGRDNGGQPGRDISWGSSQ